MFTRTKFILLTASLLLGTIHCLGQDRNIRRIQHFQLKPGMLTEFTDAIEADNKELIKSGNEMRQTWWQSTTGPSEILLVRYYRNYAEMENPNGATPLSVASTLARARANKCVESSSIVVDEILPAATVIANRERIPKFVRVLRSTAKADKVIEYTNWLEKELGPAIKKTDISFFLTSHVRYGDSGSMFITSTAMDSLAQLDGGSQLMKALGKPAYDAAMAKRASMLVNSQATLYRNLEKLNYLPKAK